MESLRSEKHPGRSSSFKTAESMTQNSVHRMTVAVLLSSREKFSAYFGGALARWTYEVYSRLRGSFDVTVFGYPTASEDLYPLRHATSSAWRLCDFTSKIPGVRRYEESLWLRALFRRLRAFDLIHIHNRPQWVSVLRDLGYKGAIVLHLQNDHLGHWTASMLDELARELEAVAVCSEYLRNTFAAKSASLASKTKVIFNGVDTDLFFPQEELRERKTILFVGRLHPEKGVLQLVQAYALVLKVHPDAKLVIGGSTGFGTHERHAVCSRAGIASEFHRKELSRKHSVHRLSAPRSGFARVASKSDALCLSLNFRRAVWSGECRSHGLCRSSDWVEARWNP